MGYTLTQVTPEVFLISRNNITDSKICLVDKYVGSEKFKQDKVLNIEMLDWRSLTLRSQNLLVEIYLLMPNTVAVF